MPSFGTKSNESRQIKERLRELSNAAQQDELSLVRRKNLEKMSTLERWLAKSLFAEQLDDLLEQAGVDTVNELKQRNPENLYSSLVEINDEKNLVRRVPSQHEVSAWVEGAKQLPLMLTY